MKVTLKVTLIVAGLVLVVIAAIANLGSDMHGSRAKLLHQTSSESNPVAAQNRSQAQRKSLSFSGYDWLVKSSDGRVGPGPNYFSDSKDNVSVDAQGRLHLQITRREEHWQCAEVISQRSFGYGTYRFYLDTKVDNLDPQVVLGMFTWHDAPAYSHREIDIEVSRWGRAENQNGQFVVQPYTRASNIVRFQIPPGFSGSTHFFTWRPDQVSCQSLTGHSPAPTGKSSIISQHTFTQGIPQAGGENARINLWLVAGRSPTDGKEIEIIVSKFEFVALP